MNSRAFRQFKTEMGQANHFLITIMVGLDAVEDGAQKRDTFNTTWNPQSINNSVMRSKQYAIKSSLALAVDNVDMYLRLCNREPKLYSTEESKDISETGHSVYKKICRVIANHENLSEDKIAYLDLLIAWRNNLVHFDAENKLLPQTENYFGDKASNDVVTQKYHLDFCKMLERFKNGDCPTFKEATTLISMAIHFVEELDNILLKELDQYKFLKANLLKALKLDHKPSVFNYTNTTSEKRKKKLKQFFATIGITADFYNEDGERFLDDVSNLKESIFLNLSNN